VVVLLLHGAICAAPERSACEIEGRVTEVSGDSITVALERFGEFLRPRAELTALDGGTPVATLAVEAIAGGRAVVTVVGEAAKVASGMTVVAPCPLPITATGPGRPFISLPSGHGLRDGARLIAWRKGERLGEFTLVLPTTGSPGVTAADGGALALRIGDVCHALPTAEGAGVGEGGEETAVVGALVVTAVEGDAVFLSFGSTPPDQRPTGRYVIKHGGQAIGVVEPSAQGPLRAAIVSLGAGQHIEPGDVAEPLVGEVALAAVPPASASTVAPTASPGEAVKPPKTPTPPSTPAPPHTAVAGAPPPTATAEAAVPGAEAYNVLAIPYCRPPGIAAPPVGASFDGPTGLIRTPNAEVVPQGDVRISITNPAEVSGSTVPEFREQWTFTTGFLPGLEVGGAYNNDPLRDITFHGKWRLLPERAGRPAIALGASNVRANTGEANYYGVASKTLLNGRLRASLGWSTGELDGPFAGLEGKLTSWATGLVEYDGERVNSGLRLTPVRRLQIDLANTEGGLSTQAAYWFSLGRDEAQGFAVKLDRPEGPAEPQALAESVAQAIVGLGFENVRVVIGDAPQGRTAGLTYENRRYYRDELEALGLVMATAARTLPKEIEYLSVVILDHQVPVLRVTTRVGDYVSYLARGMSGARFAEMLSIDHGSRPDLPPAGIVAATRRLRPTTFTGDVSVTPTFRTLFGSEEVTLAARKSLRADMDADLGNGWMLRAGRGVHLGGHLGPDLDALASDTQANLNYVFRPGPSLLAHAAGGDFADDRRGLAAEGFWMPGGGMLARGYAGWLQDRRFTYFTGEPDPEWSYLGDVRYFLGDLGLEAGATFGRYLDGDKGFTLSLRRFLNDNEVKFEYRNTDLADIVAFDLTIPIGPTRENAVDPIRLRVGDRVRGGWRAVAQSDVDASTVNTAALTGNQLRLFDISESFLDRDRLNEEAIRAHLETLRETAARMAKKSQ
jgi:hypothetical protein